MRKMLSRVFTVGVAAILTTLWGAGGALAAPTWSIDVAPEPPGAVSAALAGTDCVTAKLCFAVGQALSDEPTTSYGYIARLTQGDWLVEPTPPLDVAASALEDVDCFNGKTCMAVGQYKGLSGGPGKAYSLRLKGSAWDAQAMQSPSVIGTGTEVRGVSCPGVTTCFAVGDYSTTAGQQPLIQRWNGTAWSLQSFPLPTTNGSYLTDIDCASASSCVAVGFFFDTPTTGQAAWALHWNGTSWSQQSPEHPGVSNPFLGVSCPSATSCVAVGTFLEAGSAFYGSMVQHWNGTTWTTRPSPPTPTGDGILMGVSCLHAKECVAVGTLQSTTLANRWNGDAWQAEVLPPVGQPDSRLLSVSCVNRACVAVGYSDDSSLASHPLVMRAT